jgi:hypothetical protein
MKTIVCDICGRHKEELFKYLDNRIYRFKQSCMTEPAPVRNFDICAVCMREIKKAIKKEGGGSDE